jgi:hypothetical protein
LTGEKGIAELVFTFFRLLGREPVQIRKGIWQVFLDASLAKALDGWRGKERLFQYTFDRRLADTYGAELIAPGSYRLDTILQAVRNQARLSRAHLPHDLFHEPSIRSSLFQRLVGKAGSSIRLYVLNLERSFSPYLWVVSLVSRITHQRSDAIHHSCVDLRTGRVTPLPISNQLFVGGLPPGGTIRNRVLSYKQAYSLLCQHIARELEDQDQSWAEKAWEFLEEEQAKLARYYEGTGDQEQLAARQKALAENYAPRVLVQPVRGALLYVPSFNYKLVEVGRAERVFHATYDPLTHEVIIPDGDYSVPNRSSSS